ncbi:hypothetical protein NP493_455g02000 [Ridgeia piscesae]|uniref:Galaxin-like repeats domain-containing protein n=1 Tax=Ridgeia piscesae TaxID=27915 RepID=A0AAD9KZK1_RIDPI|nr:hypothetical protein NP493_455g02000 [Ridgeia piscesae]
MMHIWVCIVMAVAAAVVTAENGNETEIATPSVTKPPPQIALCGSRLYLVGESLCCQGDVILPRPNVHIQCCSEVRYDSRYYICCGENVVFGKHGACCEGKWGYDDRTHLCCGGKLMRKPHPRAYCCYGRVCIKPAPSPKQ